MLLRIRSLIFLLLLFRYKHVRAYKYRHIQRKWRSLAHVWSSFSRCPLSLLSICLCSIPLRASLSFCVASTSTFLPFCIAASLSILLDIHKHQRRAVYVNSCGLRCPRTHFLLDLTQGTGAVHAGRRKDAHHHYWKAYVHIFFTYVIYDI